MLGKAANALATLEAHPLEDNANIKARILFMARV